MLNDTVLKKTGCRSSQIQAPRKLLVYLGLSLWRRLGLDELLAGLIEPGREKAEWEQVACLLTIVRFCAQKSELEIAEW